MKPIPKAFLIHSAEVFEKTETDMWGEAVSSPPVAVSKVRVEPSSALKTSSRNEQVQVAALLIFDCRSSRPKGFDFSHADKVVADGVAYKVVSVDRLYDGERLHHLEVGLCL